MKTFKQFYEDVTAGGAGSAFSNGNVNIGGTAGNFPASGDAGYAPGDTRMPQFLGVYRRPGMGKLRTSTKQPKLPKNGKLKQKQRKKMGKKSS